MEPLNRADAASAEVKKTVVEVWKTTVGVQQHFNDIALRIRSLAVTLLVATLGAAGYALRETMPQLAVLVAVVGLIGWIAFYAMDHWWYHRFLIAAARHGMAIEERWKEIIPELGLASAIANSSAVELPWRGRGAKSARLDSTLRLVAFYGFGLMILLLLLAYAGYQVRSKDEAGGRPPATGGEPPRAVAPTSAIPREKETPAGANRPSIGPR